MNLFGQYKVIKNTNTVLTCTDAKQMYYIETNPENTILDTTLQIIKQDSVIIMPYYEYSLVRLYKEFPSLINPEKIQCFVYLILEKLKDIKKIKNGMQFATTNIFITENAEIKILPLSIEYDVDCISTFFTNDVAIIALELLLHENTEKNIRLKNALYNEKLDPEIREIAGEKLYEIIERLYTGRHVEFEVDLLSFKTSVDRDVYKNETLIKPKVTVIDAANLVKHKNANNNICIEAKSNIVNIKYNYEKQADSKSPKDKRSLDGNSPGETPSAETKQTGTLCDETKQVGMVVTNEEVVSKKKYTITTLSKNLADIENNHHQNFKTNEKDISLFNDENTTKSTSEMVSSDEIRKGRFLVKQNKSLSIYNKNSMNKMRLIIEKQIKIIAYLKRDPVMYKKEIKRLEDELKELGCNVDEEVYTKGSTC